MKNVLIYEFLTSSLKLKLLEWWIMNAPEKAIPKMHEHRKSIFTKTVIKYIFIYLIYFAYWFSLDGVEWNIFVLSTNACEL